MVLTRRILDRALVRVSAVVALLVVAAAGYQMATRPGFYPEPWGWVALAASAGCAGWCLRSALCRSQSRTAVRAFVAIGLLVGPVQLAWLHPMPSLQGYPPLTHVFVAAMALSAIALGAYTGRVVAIACATVMTVLLTPSLGLHGAVLQGLMFGVSGLACVVALQLLERIAAQVEATSRASWAAAEARARSERRAYERERFDGLIHDKVLGALLLAARSQSPTTDLAAADLAGQAAAALRGQDLVRPARTFAGAIANHGAGLGLRVGIHLDGGDTEPAVREALLGAIHEALTNVARHASTDRAWVTGSVSPNGCLVTVHDDGVGFQPSADPAGRAGIEVAIQARMLTVGGRADVRSRPGGGTEVTLSWEPTPEPGQEWGWDVATLTPLVVLALLGAAVNALIGADYLHHSRVPELTVAAMLVILVVTGLLAVLPLRSPWWPVVVAVASSVPGLMTLNLATLPDAADWRLWYVGALDGAVAIMALRHRAWCGVTSALAMAGGVVAAMMVTGEFSWVVILDPYPAVLCWAATAGVMRVALDRSARHVSRTITQSGRVRLETVALQERQDEADRRIAALGAQVLPMIDRIAAGESLTAQDRARCALLETSARDHLLADQLLDDDLVALVGQARRRGVTVILTARGQGDESGLAAFRRMCQVVLPTAPPGSRFQAMWRPNLHGRLGSVSLVGGSAGQLDATDLQARIARGVEPYRAVGSSDDDSVLWELELAPVPALPG